MIHKKRRKTGERRQAVGKTHRAEPPRERHGLAELPTGVQVQVMRQLAALRLAVERIMGVRVARWIRSWAGRAPEVARHQSWAGRSHQVERPQKAEIPQRVAEPKHLAAEKRRGALVRMVAEKLLVD